MNPCILQPDESWKRSPWWAWAGWLVWCVPLIVICALMLHGAKARRTVHPVYRTASENWSAQVDLYRVRAITDAETGQTVIESTFAFLYPPSFLAVYAPFTWPPKPWGEIAWRALAAFGMAWMLRALIARQPRASTNVDFALLSLAVVPVCLGALQMGQANAVLTVCMLAACLGLDAGRTWVAGAWMALGIAIKPFMLAPAALAVVLMPGCLLPMLVMSGLLLASPFLTAPSAFVWKQYSMFLQQTLGPCMNVSEDRFADFNGLLRGLGIEVRGSLSTGVRAVAGMAMVGWMLRARSRLGPTDTALLWLAASSSYLMLFNPMTEANSYCILGVPMALCAWRWIESQDRWIGWSLLGAVLAMGICSELIRPLSRPLGGQFDLRFMPLMTLLFLVALIVRFPPRSRTVTSAASQTSSG